METIKIKDLDTGYKGKSKTHVITRGINASIDSGELTCLLGANGAGKSTLLHTLSGFLPKISGTIKIMDKEIADYSERSLAKVISVVLTEKCALRNMKVTEMVGLGRSPYTGFWGTLDNEDKKIVDDAIDCIGINELKDRMMHTLSDGEKQKVMIAKALAQETPVIFLDEPTAFLDYPSKVEMMQLLHRLSREKDKTIFMSTHDLELALQIADKVWMIDRDNGITIGTPEDLSLNGTLSRYFSRKGIVFDQNTGLYKIDNEYTRQMRLCGHGQKYSMVRKALQRNGIMAGRDMQSQEYIETGDLITDRYVFHAADGGTCHASSIEQLLGIIKDYYKDI